MRLGFLLFFLFTSYVVSAQTVTISGHVTDSISGETLVGATAYVAQLAKGAVSNQYGFYSLTLPAGSIEVTFSYVGYQPREFKFVLRVDTSLDVSLLTSTLLDSVIVRGDAPDPQLNTHISTVSMPVRMISQMPALMAEPDVLKTLQFLPGVKMGSEGSSGIYVRGGGPDQNLIILDGV